MKLLLDTCCIIWAVSAPASLSRTVISLLEADDSEISVSPISSAEIACAESRGRIKLNQHWKIWFRHYIELNKWDLIDINLSIIKKGPFFFPLFFFFTQGGRFFFLFIIKKNKKKGI